MANGLFGIASSATQGLGQGLQLGQAVAANRRAQQQQQAELGFRQRAEERLLEDRARAAQQRSAAAARSAAQRRADEAFRQTLTQTVAQDGSFADLLAQNPARASEIQSFSQAYDTLKTTEAQVGKDRLRQATMGWLAAADRGDLAAMDAIVEQYPDVMGTGDPTLTPDRIKELQRTPEGVSHLANVANFAALSAGKGEPIKVGDVLVNPATGIPVYKPDGEPVEVAFGNVLVDPSTGQEIYRAPSKPVTVSAGGTLVDPTTGDIVFQAEAEDSSFENEQKLRKEYTGHQIVKDSQKIAGSYGNMRAAAARQTGAGDIALIFGYMKMLDPESVVREGEFATAQNAGGVPEQISGIYNRLIQGEKLTPSLRNDFLDLAGDVYSQQKEKLAVVNNQFGRVADENRLKRENVLYELPDIGQPAGTASGTTSTGLQWSVE